MIKAYVFMTVVGLSGIAATAAAYWWTKIRKTKNWDNYR